MSNKDTRAKERKVFYSTEKIKKPNTNLLLKMIKRAVVLNNPKILDYENIISIGADKSANNIDTKEFQQLLFKVYKIWWNEWLVKSENNCSGYKKQAICEILKQNEINPNKKIITEDIQDVLWHIETKNIATLYPWYFQGDSFCCFDTNFLSYYKPKNFSQLYDAKLYLNIKLKNIPKLAEKMVDFSLKNGIPLIFKFALNSSRNDDIVVYVNFKDIKKVADLIDDIKSYNPKLFEGCKVTNPLMSIYRGYIGYGEEPLGLTSYVADRSEVLKEVYVKLSKIYKENKNALTDKLIKKCFDATCKKHKVDSDCIYKESDKSSDNDLSKNV